MLKYHEKPLVKRELEGADAMKATEQVLIEKIKQLPPSAWLRWKTLSTSCAPARMSSA